MPEPSAIEGVLRALVEAMEAKEAAEPDLPEWEANARLRAAEANLLRLYRESGHDHRTAWRSTSKSSTPAWARPR